MPTQRKIPDPFNETETISDAAAEAEELAQAPTTPEPVTEVPATAEPPATTDQPSAQPERAIPYQRFQEVVSERNELRKYRDDWIRLNERQTQVKEAREAAERAAQQQQIAEQRPDPSIDPVGAKHWDYDRKIEQFEAWRQQQEQNYNQLQQGVQQNQQSTDFYNWVNAEAQAYMRQQPDYLDAARYAAEYRSKFWEELGLPPEQARQVVGWESQMLAQLSRQSGRPFGPAIYQLARQLGYSPQNGNGNGVTNVTPQAASQAGRILSQAARGQAMQGLSRAPSAGNEAKSRYRDMSPADLANLSEREWSAAMSNPETRRELEYAMQKADQLLDYEDVSYGGRR